LALLLSEIVEPRRFDDSRRRGARLAHRSRRSRVPARASNSGFHVFQVIRRASSRCSQLEPIEPLVRLPPDVRIPLRFARIDASDAAIS
jgi:hypothetical protein